MRPLIALLTLCACATAHAQERRWTLDECIARAYARNIEIKTQELTAEEKRIGLSEARWGYAPDISISNSYSLSTGRVLDPTTYEFVENKTVGGNSTSVGAGATLFGGLKNRYRLRRAQLDLRTSLLGVESTRRDVRLHVTAAYLEVLCAEETIRDAGQVVAELTAQEEKTARKVEVRKVTVADLLQIQSQLADAENDLLTARETMYAQELTVQQAAKAYDIADTRYRARRHDPGAEHLAGEHGAGAAELLAGHLRLPHGQGRIRPHRRTRTIACAPVPGATRHEKI